MQIVFGRFNDPEINHPLPSLTQTIRQFNTQFEPQYTLFRRVGK